MKFEAVPGAWALTYLKIMRGMSDGCYLLYHRSCRRSVCAAACPSKKPSRHRISLPRICRSERANTAAMSQPLKQIAALPVVETASGPLVLLITTRGRGHWTIPKGWPKPGVTDSALAAQEAFEEAGVEGDISPEPIGSFLYTKRFHLFSWAKCSVDVYALRTRCQVLHWPEKPARKAMWVEPGNAACIVRDEQLAAVLRGFASQG